MVGVLSIDTGCEDKYPCFLTLYEVKKKSQRDLLEGQEELEQQGSLQLPSLLCLPTQPAHVNNPHCSTIVSQAAAKIKYPFL